MPRPSKTSTFSPPSRDSKTTTRRAKAKPATRVPARRAALRSVVRKLTPIQKSRPPLWNRIRAAIDAWYQSFPLPQVNPDVVSLAGVAVAFLFIVAVSLQLFFVAWVFLIVHLFLDGLDGAITLRYRLRRTAAEKQHGQLMDVMADRASEAILFVIPPFFLPWFPLFLVNVVLTVLTFRTRQAMILPLRIVFAVVFTIQVLVR